LQAEILHVLIARVKVSAGVKQDLLLSLHICQMTAIFYFPQLRGMFPRNRGRLAVEKYFEAADLRNSMHMCMHMHDPCTVFVHGVAAAAEANRQ
jgi:hypothetical protein